MSQEDPFRCYFMGLHYLSPIQHGIQAAHVVSSMSLLIHRGVINGNLYWKWAEAPTKILCNGGFSRSDGHSGSLNQYEWILHALGYFLDYPVASFREIEMENCLTSVGIVVPDEIYEMVPENQSILFHDFPAFNISRGDGVVITDYRSLGMKELYLTARRFLSHDERPLTDVATAKLVLHLVLKSARLA